MSRPSTHTAGVVLTRGAGDDFQVFWAERPSSREFLGGFYSYAVGRVEPPDADAPLDVSADSLEPPARFYACALRELFEEFGILALRDALIAPWTTPSGPLGSWKTYRRELREGIHHLASDFTAADLTLAASRLHHLGSWTTPSWLARGFHTEFFGLHLSDEESQHLEADRLDECVDPHEVQHAEWIRPEDALERWSTGRALLTTPIRAIIEGLHHTGPAPKTALLEQTAGLPGPNGPMEVAGGIRVLPLDTQTLPPATQTNCYVLGRRRLVVVDPGSTDRSQQGLLDASLDQMLDAGQRLEAIILTHHHRDHVGGAKTLQQSFSIPVWAHEETAARVGGVDVERHLSDGESITLGGGDAWTCLHTPGHAPGHLCLYNERTDSLVAGDLVASEGTIVIDPPEGHMGQYIESLERIESLGVRTLFPAHGWAITNPPKRQRYYIEHRHHRERQVLQALEEAGSATPIDLVPLVYDEVPKHVWPLAARSLLAHLVHLVEEDRAETDGQEFWAVETR